jgi:hypothetical protein
MIRLAITQTTMITCIQIHSGDTAPKPSGPRRAPFRPSPAARARWRSRS